MADDETYRPQKKSIDPSEVKSANQRSAEENQAQLDAMAEMRANVARETGKEPTEHEGGFEIKGNMPPQFKQALQRQRGERQGGQTERLAVQPRQRPQQQANT